MNSLETTVYVAAQTKLALVTGLKLLGEYPYQVNDLGQRVPAALVEIGDVSDAEHRPGGIIAYLLNVNVWLYHRPGATRPRAEMIDLQNSIIGAMCSTMNFIPQCQNLRWEGTDKGNSTNSDSNIDLYNPGYTAGMHVWRVRFTMRIADSR